MRGSTLPIADVTLVMPGGAAPAPGLARALADALGDALGCPLELIGRVAVALHKEIAQT